MTHHMCDTMMQAAKRVRRYRAALHTCLETMAAIERMPWEEL
jgi:hypothetical protein